MNVSLKFSIKSYTELSKDELYALLQLRAEVFVVEQDCAYQDVDGKDQEALHVLGYKNEKLVAYTRIFPPGAYFEKASIGRVMVRASERSFKYGYEVMNVSIQAIKDVYQTSAIKISAQTYLLSFYNKLGFVAEGEEYLEDGIPHMAMYYSGQ